MADTTIYPYGQGGELPEGIAFTSSLDDNSTDKGATAAAAYQLKRLISSSQDPEWVKPVPCYPIDNTKPQHLGQINVIRKALQMCNVKWTPVRDSMPACGSGNFQTINGRKFFKSGVEYTGIPYSSTSFSGKAIWCDISLETFMTAVKNPNSVVYTIDLRDTLSGSLVGAYYGDNCASFGSACQGIYCVSKGRPHQCAGNRILEFPRNVESLQIGDLIMLYGSTANSGHTVIIIGIEKDEDGFITKITEAEADGTKAVVHEYTKTQFINWFLKGGYGYVDAQFYRHTGLVENTEFTQQFVGVYDQSGDISYTYSEAVAINIGNNTNFNKSDDMPIEVTLLDPSTVSSFDLYKGTTLIGSYSSSDGVAGYGSTVIVTIDKSQLATGYYEVRPSSGVSQYFCLADRGTITKSYDADGNLNITSSGHSSNVTPYGVVIIGNTAAELTRGLWLMNGESTVSVPGGWLEYIDYTNDAAYFKVVYKNDYGTIYSEKISL